MLSGQLRFRDYGRDARPQEARYRASRRSYSSDRPCVSQAQEAREIDPGVPTMDISRFILNSLYGAIFRSKTDRTERPMKLLQRFALEPFLMKKR
jgi:hypothetical protein